jgi:hypothetical protein
VKLRLGPLGAPLAIVLAWVAVRVAVLLPVPHVASGTRALDSHPIARLAPPPMVATNTISGSPKPAGQRLATLVPLDVREPSYRRASVPVASDAPSLSIAQPPSSPNEQSEAPPLFEGRSGVVAGAPRRRQAHRALTGSGWALVNGAGGAVGVPSLGGSQAGMRLFLQGESAPLALTARVSRALGAARDTEVSAGYGLRGRGLGLLVERRERLDVRSGAFVATAYGGIYDVRLPAGLRFDGFAQGGVAGLRQRRWFADGQARLTGRASLSPNLSLGAGGGTWASAQQGARRVEAGPLVEARVRTGAVGLRIAGEYRFRLTGDATPRSGPALTVGVDF